MPIAIAVDDLIELKLKGIFNGAVELNNVFHYHVTNVGTGGNAPATLDQFGWGFFETVKNSILAITSSVVVYTGMDCAILDPDTGGLVNGESIFWSAGVSTGAVDVNSLPPQDAWTFRFVRPDATFRHGYKRFAGVPESLQESGVPSAGALSGLATLASVLETVLPAYTSPDDTPDETLITASAAHPVVLQRMKNGDFLNPINVADIGDVVFARIGTQNSRKFGVGV